MKTSLLVALGVYLTGGSFGNSSVWLTILLASLLWAALYAHNEATDLTLEKRRLVDARLQTLLTIAPIVLCVVATRVSAVLALLMAGMVVSQFAYCVPPLRLKRYWWAALLLSGTLNPLLRVGCGVLWGAHQLPSAAYTVCVLLHVGASARARTLLRARDRRLGYFVAPEWAATLGKVCSGLGMVGLFALCGRQILPSVYIVFAVPASAFTIYAWSASTTSMARLRKGWFVFALCALIALAVLLYRR